MGCEGLVEGVLLSEERMRREEVEGRKPGQETTGSWASPPCPAEGVDEEEEDEDWSDSDSESTLVNEWRSDEEEDEVWAGLWGIPEEDEEEEEADVEAEAGIDGAEAEHVQAPPLSPISTRASPGQARSGTLSPTSHSGNGPDQGPPSTRPLTPAQPPSSPEMEAERRLRSVLRKGPAKGRKGRCVRFNEAGNLFYDAECSCLTQEEDYRDYGPYRGDDYDGGREELLLYQPPPIPQDFQDPPTLSPPEGYKDRFFPHSFSFQTQTAEPDLSRLSPPSPPPAKRKVFLTESPLPAAQHHQEETKKKGQRLGGILKGGSTEGHPDIVRSSEPSLHSLSLYSRGPEAAPPTKVSIGTAPLRTSEQIRLAVDSTLRGRSKAKKAECSTLVEKLRWLTSLDDEEGPEGSASGFATWPSRDKNGLPIQQPPNGKSDATTLTDGEVFVSSGLRVRGPVHEARIKQISYTLEDIEEGLTGNEAELETFVSKEGGRTERLRKRYGEEGGDDYGFSRRPSVKGIKPRFSSTSHIFAQFTQRAQEKPTEGTEAQYENTRVPPPPPLSQPDSARALNYEFQNAPGRQTEESRAHFDMIRQSFEAATSGGGTNFINAYARPHSWSVSTLPHPHHAQSLSHSMGPQQQQQQQVPNGGYGTLPGGTPQQQPIYGTVRRVPNVMGRPLFLHYGALSVEAHPNKIPVPGPPKPVPETPSPTQQPPGLPPGGIRYYGPPIRYYNQPPPVPPRTVTAPGPGLGAVVGAPMPVGINNLNKPGGGGAGPHTHPHVNVLLSMNEIERGAPEGATDEEGPGLKEPYSMNV